MTLQEFFKEHPRVAVALSGGVDSAYLLYAARQYAEAVTAYCVRTAFQPAFEQRDAERLAEELRVSLRILPLDILGDGAVLANSGERCYHCKQRIFTCIGEAARADGYPLLLDGSNASDEEAERPGMRALRELGVRSPLRDCGLGKAEIRTRSRAAGLFTWDKPAYACLATRVATGEPITEEKLARIERAERGLAELGFRDFRVRERDGKARIQVTEAQLGRVLAQREEILSLLRQDYREITLDLEVRA